MNNNPFITSTSDLFCPGFYCGRFKDGDNNTVCGSCPRGSRSDDSQNCSICLNSPIFYDWTYLTFMVLIFLIIQFYCIDKLLRSSRISLPIMILYTVVCFECFISSIVTLFLFEPYYDFNIRTCSVRSISDWYTLFFNPSTPESLNCTQEAVYPLYSIVFVFYFISLILVIFRHAYLKTIMFFMLSITQSKTVKGIYTVLYQKNFVTNIVCFTLYSIPVILFLHSIFAGIIYYIYPYWIFIGSILSIAIHLSHHIDQSSSYLLRTSVRPRNLIIVLFHWFLHGFAIVSLTGLRSVEQYLYFLLIPAPTLFYIATSKFTHPEALLLDRHFDI